MALTKLEIDNAELRDKPYKLSDGDGMFLLVQPTGGKLWRLKYRFEGKEKLLALGKYPDINLKQARNRRIDARRLLADGIDPGAQRKVEKADRRSQIENTFESTARAWYKRKSIKWTPKYARIVLARLERDLFPLLGQRPIADIKPTELLAVLRKIEARGAIETAHRARSDCGHLRQQHGKSPPPGNSPASMSNRKAA